MPKKKSLWKSFKDLFRSTPKEHNVWKTEKEENIGSYVHYGNHPEDICTMYRIAVYQRCLVTQKTRIIERVDIFPVQ